MPGKKKWDEIILFIFISYPELGNYVTQNSPPEQTATQKDNLIRVESIHLISKKVISFESTREPLLGNIVSQPRPWIGLIKINLNQFGTYLM